MKLRIKGNSLRLRVSRSEVARVLKRGACGGDDSICVGCGRDAHLRVGAETFSEDADRTMRSRREYRLDTR
jgi:uncharacterized protein DUF7009